MMTVTVRALRTVKSGLTVTEVIGISHIRVIDITDSAVWSKDPYIMTRTHASSSVAVSVISIAVTL